MARDLNFSGMAERWWDHSTWLHEFEDALDEVIGDDHEFDKLGSDSYDASLEIRGASNDLRLNDDATNLIAEAGFLKVYVNHLDGWETHYGVKTPARGWRRRYVSDPEATTTNVIAGPENNGYYEISYWPEGWTGAGSADWLETGYMRIVPDPLDPAHMPVPV